MCKDDGAKPATNSTTNAPWSGAVPYITAGLDQAAQLYNAGGPAYYSGQTYAGSNPALDKGISDLSGISGMYGGLRDSANSSITGINNSTAEQNPAYSFFNSRMNMDPNVEGPGFQTVLDRTRADVLPGINSQFAAAGRGNSGMAARAASLGLGDAIGSLRYQNYNDNLSRQNEGATNLSGLYQSNIANRLNAASVAPTVQNMGINAGNASLLAGTTQQGINQGQIDADKARYDYYANLPYKNLKDYISNITAQTQGTGQTTGTATPAQPSFWNQALSAGLGAASFFV